MGCFTQIMSALRDRILRLKQDKPLCIKVVVALAAVVLLLIVIIVVASVVSSDDKKNEEDVERGSDTTDSTTFVPTSTYRPEDAVRGYFVIDVGQKSSTDYFKQELALHPSLPIQIAKFESDGYDVYAFQNFTQGTQLIAGIKHVELESEPQAILFCTPAQLQGELITVDKLKETSGLKTLNVNGGNINFNVTFVQQTLKIPKRLLSLLTGACSSIPKNDFLQTLAFNESLTCQSNETGSWTCQNAGCMSENGCLSPNSTDDVCMKYRRCAKCDILSGTEIGPNDQENLPDCKCRKLFTRDINNFPCSSPSADPNCETYRTNAIYAQQTNPCSCKYVIRTIYPYGDSTGATSTIVWQLYSGRVMHPALNFLTCPETKGR